MDVKQRKDISANTFLNEVHSQIFLLNIFFLNSTLALSLQNLVPEKTHNLFFN